MMPAQPHRHLDDETLNAVLDGEASPAEGTDAAGCGQCSARLHRLAEVAEAVATSHAAPDVARRRAMIDVALQAGQPDVAAPPNLASRRRRRVAPAWLAAAAVIAVGALAVPLLDDLGGLDQAEERATVAGAPDDTETDSASGDAALADQQARPGDERSAMAPAPPVPADNLGAIDVNSLDELSASIGQDYAQRQPLDLSAPGVAPAAEAARPDVQDQPAGAGAGELGQPCAEAARQRDGGLGGVIYAAEATVDGRPAVVLAFEVTSAGAPPSLRLLLLAVDDCAELGSA